MYGRMKCTCIETCTSRLEHKIITSHAKIICKSGCNLKVLFSAWMIHLKYSVCSSENHILLLHSAFRMGSLGLSSHDHRHRPCTTSMMLWGSILTTLSSWIISVLLYWEEYSLLPLGLNNNHCCECSPVVLHWKAVFAHTVSSSCPLCVASRISSLVKCLSCGC